MLIRRYRTILLALLMVFSHIALANELGQKIATQGNAKGATACIACHGVDGAGLVGSDFPGLAGLNSSYLEKQLYDFTKATRNNPIMTPIANALSGKEIKAVTAYFAKMKLTTPKSKSPANNTLLQAGKKLAEKGNWSKDIPACFACHGVGASGIGIHFPALAGQQANYIEQQMLSWQNGQRRNDPNQLMKGVAMRLSKAEIKAVSAYLASLTVPGN